MVLEAENSQKSATLKKTHLEKKLLNTMCRGQAKCNLTHEPHESKNDYSVREAISVKPSELFFLLSRTSELNIEAATEDRLVWEPRPIAWSSISVEVFCVLVTL
ncbi:hypothetical protein P5673_006723 [Acropora cervicornis]|uniref:Uncharacterized protein n=1 Tax=Acropora cervicornis TaxID=6130 RepID=A0AAD9QWK2_ACRCE|nr:hypothetical protein P5673_006723 [Acropora cervicornis]